MNPTTCWMPLVDLVVILLGWGCYSMDGIDLDGLDDVLISKLQTQWLLLRPTRLACDVAGLTGTGLVDDITLEDNIVVVLL